MTKQEAIDLIKSDGIYSQEVMDALEQEQSGDLINREELLKAIDTWDKFGCDADTKLVRYQDHYIPYIHYDDVIKCIKGMPSVNPQEPNTDVLDKIRAEIDRIQISGQINADTSFIRNGEHVKQMALNIIDKYKAESEDKE